MRRSLVIAVLVFALAAGIASAVFAADLKIGFVDVDKAANESAEGKKAIANLKDLMASKQATVTEKGKAIEKMKADLEKQSAIISPDARRAKVDEIERAERDFQRMVSDTNAELDRKRRELTESIYKEILETVDKIGHEQKFDLIVPVQSIIYGNRAYDLTGQVIKRYNELKQAAKSSSK